jgi:hypothetical protein
MGGLNEQNRRAIRAIEIFGDGLDDDYTLVGELRGNFMIARDIEGRRLAPDERYTVTEAGKAEARKGSNPPAPDDPKPPPPPSPPPARDVKGRG